MFVSGAGVQWLRDGLGLIDQASDMEPLARSVDSSEGVVVVPAFTGLGSPYWDPGARGTIVGLSRGTGRAHLARAMVEAMGFQIRDVVDAMAATGTARHRPQGGRRRVGHGPAPPTGGRSDPTPGGQTRLGRDDGLGAASLAGLAEGVWGSLDDLAALWTEDEEFVPSAPVVRVRIGPRGVAPGPRPVPGLGR